MLSPQQVQALQKCKAAMDEMRRYISVVEVELRNSQIGIKPISTAGISDKYYEIEQALELQEMAESKARLLAGFQRRAA